MLYLYRILNKCNGKCYFGVTKDPKKREKEHFSGRGSPLVKQAVTKYGGENLEFRVLWCGEEKAVLDLEVKAVERFDSQVPNGYNLTTGGECGCKHTLRYMPTSKTKEKMRAAHLGNVHSPETREKMRVAHQGKRHALGCRHTPEANEKKRKASLGNKNNAAKTVEVRGVTYKCMKDAATAIGMNTNTLYTRIRRYNKTNNWPDGWGYVT